MEPTRDEVFAYLDAEPGRKAADAAAHFGAEGRTIDAGKIRVWMLRRREALAKPPKPPKAEPVALVAAREEEPDEAPQEPVTEAGPEPETVAVTEEVGVTIRPPNPTPTHPSRARATPPTLTPLLGDELRANLKRAVRGLAKFVADVNDPDAKTPLVENRHAKPDEPPGRLPNMNDVDAAARALKTLLTMTPDILTFDEKTNAPKPGDDAGDSDALDAGVRAALGRTRDEAPA